MMSCCNGCHKEKKLWLGLISFVIGAVVLLQLFQVIPDTTWDYLWPSILVIVGLKLMLHSCNHGCCGEECDPMDMKEMKMDAPMAPKKKAPAKKKPAAKKKK